MDLDRLESILSRFSYKPGYTFYAGLIDQREVGVFLSGWVEDAERPGDRIQLYTIEAFPMGLVELWSEEDVLEAVRAVCVRFERHEIEEWLRRDGARVHEPHPERRAA